MKDSEILTYPLSTCEISAAVICGNVEYVKREIICALVRLSRGRPVALVDERLGTVEPLDALIEWLDWLDWRHPGHAFRTWAEQARQYRCRSIQQIACS